MQIVSGRIFVLKLTGSADVTLQLLNRSSELMMLLRTAFKLGENPPQCESVNAPYLLF